MPRAPKRPATAITAGVILIVYGALLLICSFCGGAAMMIKPPDQAGVEKMLQKEMPGYQIADLVNIGTNLVIGVGMIAAGVGVFQLMQSARITAYFLTAVQLVKSVVYSAYTAVVVFPVMQRVMAEQMKNNAPMPPNMDAIFQGSMLVGLILGLLIPLAFCLPIMVCLSLQSARKAFAGVNDAGPPEDDHRAKRDDYDDDYDDGYGSPRGGPKSPPDTGITDRP
ncbi:MAG: hypothetical protein EXR98_10640 [Gemmataceae bacterium]|nr:hypothetical protein [Gemmataceae bacterium]